MLFVLIVEMMIKGVFEGWKQMFDKLECEVVSVLVVDGIQCLVVYVIFMVECMYDVLCLCVFKVLIDLVVKVKWFVGGNGYMLFVCEMDVMFGGCEIVKGWWDSGVVFSFEVLYYDVILNECVVYLYVMYLDDCKIFVLFVMLELCELKDGFGGMYFVMIE